MRIPHGLRAALAGQGGTPTPSTDANFENTVLLLHGDGTNGAQNNTFTDGSTNNFTITRNGNTTQGTFSPYGDNWSNYFDGTGDYLSVANSSSFAFGTGDFTVEFWLYANSSSTAHGLVASDQTGNYWASLIFSNLLYWQNANGSSNLFSTSYSNYYDQWTHVAFVRNSGTVRLYLNGVQITSASDNTNYTSTSGNIDIGRDQDNSALLNGYISNLRIVKGTAVYTSNFTPSTTPLTAITNTSLLTCQSNRFRDASTNNFTITRNGDVSVQRFSPFSPAAAYSSSTIGGSGYLQNSVADYLTTPSSSQFNMGTGDWTVEGWFYTNKTLNDFNVTWHVGTINATDGMAGSVATTSVGFRSNGTTDFTATVSIANAWTHIAWVKVGSSNTVTIYVNGTSVASGTYSNSIATGSFTVGFNNTSFRYGGYISNFRVLKGTAQYTSSFTPPTSPVTAITNTSLLLNFTNGGIIDNTMMNDLETVGNAQISTSVKKYGTGSLAFDGTGDYLTIPSTSNLAFGTGPYTIEFWLYSTTSSGERGVLQTQTASLYGVNIFLDGTTIYIDERTNTYSSSDPRISGSITQNAWVHVAICRQTGTSGTLRVFVDGTQIGSSVTSNLRNLSSTGPVFVGTTSIAANPLNGYIDDLRITKGVARYTANFTPPTAALPDL